ncbi:MAG: SDR family NAD(P)-dependent oxidoreductase [Planctomycetes bacterium]|nr:SDR family NAD(P)-dependent oxidoreductase [Planctomycetota bacterium]
MKFPHEVVVITGASSGIGAEMAVQLGRLGCKLALLARREDKLNEVAAKVEAAGGKALVLPCDVSDAAAVAQAMGKAVQAFGPIDCVIANAGVGQQLDKHDYAPETVERIFRINMLGMTNAFYAALPGMLERSRGHLVAVASLASYQGMPRDGGYAASKAAMRTHCEGLRIELRGSGVDVTCICPGFIRTPITDKNNFDMPFLLEVKPATRRMLRAIAKRRRVFNFPRRLWWLIKIGQRTPRWLYDWIIAGQESRVNAGRTQKRSTDI